MPVWREASWEALARGEHCDPRWSAYGEYAELRSQGLRQEALVAAQRCAGTLLSSNMQLRWEFTSWVCTQLLAPGAVRSVVIPHQLESIVVDELWAANERGDAHAALWLARWFPVEVMARYEYVTDAIGELLRNAHQKIPQSTELRRALSEHLVNWVQIDAADLVNNRFDGDVDADLQRLSDALALVSPSDPIAQQAATLRTEIIEWKLKTPKPK